MPRSLRALGCALIVLGLLVVPVAADTEEDVFDAEIVEAEPCRPILDEDEEPTGEHLCTSQHWFTANDAKAGNVEGLTQIEGESSLGFPSWDDTEPASVTTGSGGGYLGSSVLDIPFEMDPAAGVTYEGELVGNVDSLAIDQYLFQPLAMVPLADSHGFRARITVDGRAVVSSGQFVSVATEPGGDAVLRMRFAVTGLLGRAGNLPDDEKVRTVRITLTPWGIPEDDALYVYDAAEAPSSMIVNPTDEQLEDFTLIPRS